MLAKRVSGNLPGPRPGTFRKRVRRHYAAEADLFAACRQKAVARMYVISQTIIAASSTWDSGRCNSTPLSIPARDNADPPLLQFSKAAPNQPRVQNARMVITLIHAAREVAFRTFNSPRLKARRTPRQKGNRINMNFANSTNPKFAIGIPRVAKCQSQIYEEEL